MPLTNISTILFDWDLTLVNSLPAAHKAIADLNKLFDIDFLENDLARYYGMNFHQNLRDVHQKNVARLPSYEEFEEEYKKHFHKHFSELGFEKKFVLEKAEKSGYKLGIVTYNSSTPVRNVLTRHNLEVKVVIGHDDLPDGEGKEKGIKMALDELGSAKEEAAYVGDHSNDILEAKAAGVKAISVATGFTSREELAAHDPHLLLEKVEELLEYL